MKSSGNVLYIHNCFCKSEKNCFYKSCISAALKKFGLAFEELNKGVMNQTAGTYKDLKELSFVIFLVLRTSLVKYYYKLTYKKNENTASSFRFVSISHVYKVYIIDTWASKTHHTHSQQPHFDLMHAFYCLLFCLNSQGDMQA